MQINENLIRSVVEQVLSEVRNKQTSQSSTTGSSGSFRSAMGRHGLFDNVDDAVRAARTAFEQLRERTIADRRRLNWSG